MKKCFIVIYLTHLRGVLLMKNRVFTKTVDGVADFLIDVNKSYSVNLTHPKDIIRVAKTSKYPSIMEECNSVHPIKYRIHISPSKNSSDIVISVAERSYIVQMTYKSDSRLTLGFKFNFPQETVSFKEDLSQYVSNPFKSESIIDRTVNSIIRKDLEEIFKKQKKNASNEFHIKLDTEKPLKLSSPELTLTSNYIFE